MATPKNILRWALSRYRLFYRPARAVLRTRMPNMLALLLGEPSSNVVGEDYLLGGMGTGCASKHGQPFVQFRAGEYFCFGFGRKHFAFARAALFLLQQAALPYLKSDIPDQQRNNQGRQRIQAMTRQFVAGTLIYVKIPRYRHYRRLEVLTLTPMAVRQVMTRNPKQISTSYVERSNLTMRVRRFTRLHSARRSRTTPPRLLHAMYCNRPLPDLEFGRCLRLPTNIPRSFVGMLQLGLPERENRWSL